MTTRRDRTGDALVVLSPGMAGALDPAARHVIAAAARVPSALIELEARAGRPVFLSAHRGVGAARRQAATLALKGVTTEVHAPGAGFRAFMLGTAVLMGATLGGLAAMVSLLAGGSMVLAALLVLTGGGIAGSIVALTTGEDHTTVTRADAEAARERTETLQARNPRAWDALVALQAEVPRNDLPPEATADLWRSLDRAGDGLLGGMADEAFVDHLESARTVLADSPATRGSSAAAEQASRSARAAAQARKVLDIE